MLFFKNSLVIFLMALSLFNVNSPPAFSNEHATENYIFPTGHTLNSQETIDYNILSALLSKIVINVGLSEHIHAPRPLSSRVTRLIAGNKKSSRLEANRVAYTLLTDDNIEEIGALKTRMEAIPSLVPLEAMSKDTQLAYWLNLHNITILHALAERYPVADLKKLKLGGEQCKLITLGCRKIEPILQTLKVTINNRATTLQDIRQHVLTNWDNPLVMYGFFMGYIGGPNILESAYTRNNVWQRLRANAREFINSIRGTQIWGNELLVSEHFEFGRHFFPNFESDFKQHLYVFADKKLKSWLGRNPKITISVTNWGIADLYNGQPGREDIFEEFSVKIINKFKRQRRRGNPTVDIEEIESGDTPKSEPLEEGGTF